MEHKDLSLYLLEGTDLPDGVGFALFGGEHLSMLLVLCLLIAALAALAKRQDEGRFRMLLRGISLCLILGNLLRDLYLLALGRMGISYLPLHLCSLSIFVYGAIAFTAPESDAGRRIRSALCGISVCLLLPGSLCALLLPDWTRYPILNVLSLHSFAWHGLLAAFPVLLLVRGEAVITRRTPLWCVLFLLVITPPVLAFNERFGTNYLFVSRPLPGTPLELFYRRFGAYWRIPYALSVLAVICVFALLASLLTRQRGPSSTGRSGSS